MDLKLRGKRALITGGTSGIGKAIATALAEEGASLSICGRNPEKLSQTLKALQPLTNKQEARLLGEALEITDEKALKVWINQSAETLGGVDILISCVSGFGTQHTPEDWQVSFDVDIKGTLNTIEYTKPYLEASKAATILLISSNAALDVFDDVFTPEHLLPYASMKRALNTLGAHLSRSLGAKGIRTNLISPGAIETTGGVWQKRKSSKHPIYNRLIERCPLGRLGQPKEVAQAACFLVSEAAAYINGCNLVIDGGQLRST